MVVLSPERDGYGELATEIADLRGEAVVDSLESLDPEQTVIYVTEPAADEELLLALQRRFLEHGPEQGRFGVITGLDVDSARGLYDRGSETPDRERHVTLMNEGPQEFAADEDAPVYVKHDVSTENLRSELERGITSLTFQSGGWPIHVRLADGLVCGVPESRSVEQADGPLPFCVEDGDRNCPIVDEENLVSADAVDADHYCLVSCSTVIDNGSCDKMFNAALNLLDGATSLIGSYCAGGHEPFQTLLHHSLVRAGYDLAERCYLLNRSGHAHDTMAYPYVPMGRPDASTGEERTHSEYEYAAEDGTARITLRDVDAPVIDLSIPEADLPLEVGDDRYLRRTDDADVTNELRYVTVQEESSIRLVVYTGAQIRAEALSFELDTAPYGDARRQIAWDALENARENRTWGLLPEESADQIRNLRDQLKSLRRHRDREAVDPDAWRDAESRIKSALGNVGSLRDALVAEIGAERVKEYHRGAINHSADVTDQRCPTCGRRLSVKNSTYPDADEVRALGFCPQCGSSAFDLPVSDRVDDRHFPYLSVEEATSDGRFSLEFTNPRRVPMEVLFRPTVWRVGDEASGEPLFEPREVERRLDPGETTTVEFTLDADALWDNEHYLLFRAIGNLLVFARAIDFPVGESRGHLNPQFR